MITATRTITLKTITFDGTKYPGTEQDMPIRDALMYAACEVYKTGQKAVRASINLDSLTHYLVVNRHANGLENTVAGTLRLEPSLAVGPQHATLYDELGHVVAEVTLSA